MSLDWDVLLNGLSIKDEIAEFTIKKAKYTYVDEMTLFSVNPSFFDNINYSVLPELLIEIKTKLTDTWISQGFFYIEKSVYTVTPRQKISSGVWGRSSTAKAGSPFSQKVSKTWNEDTTFNTVIDEMAALVGLTVNYDVLDYTLFSNAFSVDSQRPIEVIQSLCNFSGSFVSCNSNGELVIRKEIYHPGIVPDHEIVDINIIDLSEKVIYPEFGNRVKVSSFSSNSAYSVELVSLDNAACLSADGSSILTVLAFVDLNGIPVEDNVVVSWSSEQGVSLGLTESPTQKYLIDAQTHKASNYNKVTVDYPIYSIVGIWAYADTTHQNNFWNTALVGCSFEGKTITVHDPFTYCDQTLVISYMTSGCSVNTVIAGENEIDTSVSASLEGAEGTLEIKLGNPCACGVTLNAILSNNDAICIGNCTQIISFATIGNEPALGYAVELELEGSGRIKYSKRTLGYVNVYSEVASVFNVIEGISQVKTKIPIAEGYDQPRVYRKSSTGTNRYGSHDGQTIDLNYQYETGIEMVIYYTAAGAATSYWCPTENNITEEELARGVSSKITINMASGSEEFETASVSVSAEDCTVIVAPEPLIPPDPEPDPMPEPDPEPAPGYPLGGDGGLPGDGDGSPDGSPAGDPAPSGLFPGEPDGSVAPDSTTPDGSDDSGDAGGNGTEPSSGGAATSPESKLGDGEGGTVGLTPCSIFILNKMANYDTIIGDDKKTNARFGVENSQECDEPACTCTEICESEMYEKGNTYDQPNTIHEQALEIGDEGSPEYNEAYAQLQIDNVASCSADCEDHRDSACGDCLISGPAVLSPGESAEYICSDGTIGVITMPEGVCGTQTFTIGCCDFQIRSTVGKWVDYGYTQDPCSIHATGSCGTLVTTTSCAYDTLYDVTEIPEAGIRNIGIIFNICPRSDWADYFDDNCTAYDGCPSGSACTPPECPSFTSFRFQILNYDKEYRWECDS